MVNYFKRAVKVMDISEKNLAGANRATSDVHVKVNTSYPKNKEPHVKVNSEKVNTIKQLNKEDAFKLLEGYIKKFRSELMKELKANKNHVSLKVFSLDKDDIHGLSSLNWADMFNFSKENQTVKNLKEECKRNNINCYVKEKAGILTIICSSDDFIFRQQVNKLTDCYKM